MRDLSRGTTKSLFFVYALLVYTWMCVSNQTLYTNFIPTAFLVLLSLVSLLVFVFFASRNKIRGTQAYIIILISIVYFLLLVKNPNVNIYRLIFTIGAISNLSALFFISVWDRLKLLEIISNLFVICLFFSICGWVMNLAGHPLPVLAYVDFNDDVHFLNNCILYYDNADFTFLPRFRGFFIEPGQLATPCVFLFFARGGKFKDWRNIILLIAIVLSFSLAGYIALLIGVFLKSIFVSKKFRIVKLLLFTLIVGGAAFFTIQIADEDNPLYSLIIQRLEFDDEKGIAGNNRTDDVFEYHFSQYVKSSKILFGIGDELPAGDANWGNHASGIKKFFLNYGLIGVLCMLLLTLRLLKQNYCKEAIVFFIVLWVAYVVRDLLQSQFWLIIAILGFCNIKLMDWNSGLEKKVQFKNV